MPHKYGNPHPKPTKKSVLKPESYVKKTMQKVKMTPVSNKAAAKKAISGASRKPSSGNINTNKLLRKVDY